VVLEYLVKEQARLQPTAEGSVKDWELIGCFPDNDTVPRQKPENNCGVYTCLFMDFLMINLPLCPLKDRNETFFRTWLCDSILRSKLT
jgi:Ulp1 family protease